MTEIGCIRSSDEKQDWEEEEEEEEVLVVLEALELVNVSTYTYNRFHTTF